jgi:hypothetical protein
MIKSQTPKTRKSLAVIPNTFNDFSPITRRRSVLLKENVVTPLMLSQENKSKLKLQI